MKNGVRNLMVLGVLAIMLMGLALSFHFIAANEGTLANARVDEELLHEAEDKAQVLRSVLLDQAEILRLASARLEEGALVESSVKARLGTMVRASVFDSLGYISPGGTAFVYPENEKDMLRYRCVQTALSGKNAVQRTRAESGKPDRIFLATPCERNNRIIGAVVGSYTDATMREIINSRLPGESGCSFVIDSGGNVVVGARETTAMSNYSNLTNFLAKAVFDKGRSRTAVLEDLTNGHDGTVRFKHSGVDYVASYASMSDETLSGMDWFVLDIGEAEVLAGRAKHKDLDLALSAKVFAVFTLVAMCAFVVFEVKTRGMLKREDRLLRMREERYRLIVAESGREVFQYNIVDKSAHRDNIVYDYFGDSRDCPDWLDFLARSGAVDDENLALFKDMFGKIDSGVTPVSFDASMIHPGGGRDWNRFTANTIFSDDNRPLSAVISYYNRTYMHESEAAYQKWLDDAAKLDGEFMARFFWNLTKDRLEQSQCESRPEYAVTDGGMSEWADAYLNRVVVKEDRSAYKQFFAADRLLGAFEHGQQSESIDYRAVCENGERWIRLTARLTRHPQSCEVRARLIYNDIDAEKRRQLDIIARSETDSLTGALNREALVKKAESLIAANPSSTHAFLMMDVDGFKPVNDILGHDEGDETLKRIVSIIKNSLRSDDVVGRIGGDEIMVVLKDIPYDAVIRKKARQLCDMLRLRIRDRLDISVSIGISLYPRDARGYDELYKCADQAMYMAKKNGKNGYFFYNQLALRSSGRASAEDDMGAFKTGASDRRVIYAGDDMSTVKALRETLGESADVVVTSDKRQTLVAIRQGATEKRVAVMDFEAIERTVEAVSACRAGSASRDVPIIAVVLDDYEMERAMAAGANDYITRPVNAEALASRINACAIRIRDEIGFYNVKVQDLMREEEENYSRVMLATNSAMAVLDWSNSLFTYNPSMERVLFGSYDKRPLWRILQSDMVARSTDVKRMQNMVARLVNNPEAVRDEMAATLKTASGERHVFRFQLIKLEGGQASAGRIMLVFTDINDAVEKNDKLVFRAERDRLTGLYNNETFFEKAKEAIRQKDEGYYTICSVDLDDFELINEQFGAGEANRILTSMAERLSRAAHSGNSIVGRVYSDNFAILCQTAYVPTLETVLSECMRGVERYADYLLSALHAGKYLITDKNISVRDMYERAVIAINSIKRRCDRRMADFTDEMLSKLLRDREMAGEMEKAMDSGEFEIAYQPQFDVNSRRIVGAEALVRWNRGEAGVLQPDDFIPLFESNGFISRIDRYVLNAAAEAVALRVGGGKTVVPISVNVSENDLIRPEFIASAIAIVQKHNVPPSLIRFETALCPNAQTPLSALSGAADRLKDAGFAVLIDGFGSETPLSAITDIRVDGVKLSRELVSGAGSAALANGVIAAVVKVAGQSGVPVAAVGVETDEQFDFIRSAGVNECQGFLLGAPAPWEDLVRALA